MAPLGRFTYVEWILVSAVAGIVLCPFVAGPLLPREGGGFALMRKSNLILSTSIVIVGFVAPHAIRKRRLRAARERFDRFQEGTLGAGRDLARCFVARPTSWLSCCLPFCHGYTREELELNCVVLRELCRLVSPETAKELSSIRTQFQAAVHKDSGVDINGPNYRQLHVFVNAAFREAETRQVAAVNAR